MQRADGVRNLNAKLLKLGLVGIALVPSSAWANWQFTKWGMSPAALLAAKQPFGSISKAPEGRYGEIQYVGRYRSGAHEFRVTYAFTKSGLSSVTLDTVNGCGDLAIEMKSTYGDRVSHTEIPGLTTISRWRDVKRGNDVQLLDSHTQCSLIYTRLDAESQAGL